MVPPYSTRTCGFPRQRDHIARLLFRPSLCGEGFRPYEETNPECMNAGVHKCTSFVQTCVNNIVMMECWWLLGKNDSIGTLRPHEWERIEEEIWEKTDCHKQDVTTFPCVMKGEALNYFGDLRFGGRRSAVRLSAELTLPSLCCVLYCGTRRWILCSRWKPACSRPEDHYSLCVRVFVDCDKTITLFQKVNNVSILHIILTTIVISFKRWFCTMLILPGSNRQFVLWRRHYLKVAPNLVC